MIVNLLDKTYGRRSEAFRQKRWAKHEADRKIRRAGLTFLATCSQKRPRLGPSLTLVHALFGGKPKNTLQEKENTLKLNNNNDKKLMYYVIPERRIGRIWNKDRIKRRLLEENWRKPISSELSVFCRNVMLVIYANGFLKHLLTLDSGFGKRVLEQTWSKDTSKNLDKGLDHGPP